LSETAEASVRAANRIGGVGSNRHASSALFAVGNIEPENWSLESAERPLTRS